ncbi:hypothetical protein [Silicimonas algicola]|uniref:hypothetical protein n=1 Tax=Silicimonas algicola TaxID=1826607 RepID=UPI0020110655|nr:hypothetical protein [Silicimonas algicola]
MVCAITTGGLLAVRGIKPNADERLQAAAMVTFLVLLALHTIEILAFAVVYNVLLGWGELGQLGGSYDASREGLISFSGINFATLGLHAYRDQLIDTDDQHVAVPGRIHGADLVGDLPLSVCERAWRG